MPNYYQIGKYKTVRGLAEVWSMKVILKPFVKRFPVIDVWKWLWWEDVYLSHMYTRHIPILQIEYISCFYNMHDLCAVCTQSLSFLWFYSFLYEIILLILINKIIDHGNFPLSSKGYQLLIGKTGWSIKN